MFASSANTGLAYVSKRFLLSCTVAGTGTCSLRVYAAVSNPSGPTVWGTPVDGGGNQGTVAGGVQLSAGPYFVMLEDMGLFSAICVSHVDADPTNKPMSVVATISAISEVPVA